MRHGGMAAQQAKIQQWMLEGKTHAWIAKELGCSHQTISKVCRRWGIQPQRRGPRAAEGHPDWKGGRTVDKSGYVLIYAPDHPHRRKMGKRPGRYVAEHRLVMERHLGRLLERGEVVHHKNGIRDDNRIENLQLFAKNADHLKAELTGHRPDWTPAGYSKMCAPRGKAYSRPRTKPYVRPYSRTSGHPPASPASTAPNP